MGLEDGSRSYVGAVAQLGERGLCKPEVVGSIPSSSTKPTVGWLRKFE